ncbi:gluconate 2-dehydrogenase subunit 3 family protein [Dyadobacter tibetensis]|uniref:gluconate 2-dehydrogenase subunit 3 family protein n=1 Tax=Dyadobacter tibetensis TaxID=1211851 RepID=UPI00046E75E2|nr:gluconate 2-dehydrogenase subunit 3 family protein [Dyadobacter tibetensis]
MLNRRNALKQIAMAAGMAFSSPTLMAMNRREAGEAGPESQFSAISADDNALIGMVAEMIIPESDTAGAIRAGVPAFIIMMIQDCYHQPEQLSFREGLDRLHRQNFMGLSAEQRLQSLTRMEEETIQEMKAFQVKQTKMGDNEDREQIKKQASGLPFWRLMKELTLLGYFTSEEGIKGSFEYVPVPGKFELTRLAPGQKIYAY